MTLDLVGRIYAHARKFRELERPRIGDKRQFHASEAGDCPRQIALRKLGGAGKRDEDAHSLLRLRDGTMHHEYLRSLISSIDGIHITNAESAEIAFIELENVPPFVITGHCDGILHADGEQFILEVKGLNRFSAQKCKSEDIETLKQAYPKAIPQARLYMYMYDVKKAIILIKSKDTAELKQFTLEHDDKKLMRIVEKFAGIAKHLAAGTLPSCTELSTSWECKYCDFPGECGKR